MTPAFPPQEQPQIPQLSLKERIKAEKAKRSLYEFAQQAWHIIEPSTPFVGGWHLEAIAAHLEACSKGQIRALCINVPPRHSKSLFTSVFWNAWAWASDPSIRWLCSSYALSLAVRDNRKCKILVESDWYKARWGDVVKISRDQSGKQRFENTARGYRLAVSTESAATGEGGTVVLCITGDTVITTEIGNFPIKYIVDNKLDTKILSYNHYLNRSEWEEIEAYECYNGRRSVRVTFSDGRYVESTHDHPFYVIGKGYIKAENLTKNDEVITNDNELRELWQGVFKKGIRSQEIKDPLLQHGMPQTRNYYSLRYLRKRNDLQTIRNGKVCSSLLLLCLLQKRKTSNLRNMRQSIYAPTRSNRESRTPLLQQSLSLRENKQNYHPSRAKQNYDLYLSLIHI